MSSGNAGPGPHASEAGSAVVEFIVIGIGVLVPLVYVVLSAMTVHTAAFASAQAVREAGRAFSTAVTASDGRKRALTAARLAFADHGLDLPDEALRLTCEGPCLTPGSTVDVALDWRVPLPWLPATLAEASAASVPVSAAHRVPIDDYRSSQDAGPS